MREERLSSIERMHLADEERQRRGGAIFVPARPAASAEASAQAARQIAARALPDAMFMGDAEVQRLHATYVARKAVAENSLGTRRWLEGEIQRLADRAQTLERGAAWAALADAQAQDGEFPQARRVLDELASAKALGAAAREAHSLVASSDPTAHRELNDGIAQARAALQGRLVKLKLAHVDAQATASEVQ